MIAPLRNTKPDGTPYSRIKENEAKLVELTDLSRDLVLERARITLRTDPDYIPSECLVHLVRRTRFDNSERWFEQLYGILMRRVMRSLPRSESSDGETASLTKEAIRNKVIDRFQEILATDRQVYALKLDFFEIRFDLALKRLRQDAEKQAWRDENRSVPITYEDDTGEVSAEVEAAVGSFDTLSMSENFDEAFRLRLEAAIDVLPIEQKRTIHMLRLGFQMHSTDPNVMTIAKALNVTSPKTIWNYRERAIKTLRAALFVGGDQ